MKTLGLHYRASFRNSWSEGLWCVSSFIRRVSIIPGDSHRFWRWSKRSWPIMSLLLTRTCSALFVNEQREWSRAILPEGCELETKMDFAAPGFRTDLSSRADRSGYGSRNPLHRQRSQWTIRHESELE